jgi:hypothetical protein
MGMACPHSQHWPFPFFRTSHATASRRRRPGGGARETPQFGFPSGHGPADARERFSKGSAIRGNTITDNKPRRHQCRRVDRSDRVQLQPDRCRRHDHGQGRGLQESTGHDLRPGEARPAVDRSGQSPNEKKRGEEHRHPQHRPGVREQRPEVELDTAGHEEDRDEESMAEALQFDVEPRMRPFRGGVDQPQHILCHEGTHNRFEREMRGDRGQADSDESRRAGKAEQQKHSGCRARGMFGEEQ